MMSMRMVVVSVWIFALCILWKSGTVDCFSLHRGNDGFVVGRRRVQPVSQVERYSSLSLLSSSLSSSSSDMEEVRTNKSGSSSGSGSVRRVVNVEEATRLPVWPVWNGVLIFLFSKVFGKGFAAKCEEIFGGRVCPMILPPDGETSPFVLLVHHRHSFAKYDLFRWIQQKLVLAEGFPAHPHRGFITLTYILQGGMKHRDSLGIQQIYTQHQSQWLFTGSGMLHEEMWFNFHQEDITQQELYQLWINVPSQYKLNPPTVTLLGDQTPHPTPTHTTHDGSTTTIVIYGQHQSTYQSYVCPQQPNVNVFHIQMQPHATWTHHFISQQQQQQPFHDTVLLYVRKGTLIIDQNDDDDDIDDERTTITVPTHALVTFSKTEDTIRIKSGSDGADVFFLSGQDLKEPIEQQGSMVMNTPQEIQKAYLDYQSGKMGLPWDYKLTDDEWKQHIQKTSSAMITSTENYIQ